VKETACGTLAPIARAAAAFFAFSSVIGFVMYLDHQDSLAIAYLITTLVALVLFAAYPRKALTSSGFRVLLPLLAVLATATTIPLMYRDVTLVNAPDYGGLVLRSLECGIFALMAWEPFVCGRSAFQ
jgi:hypothetical protein